MERLYPCSHGGVGGDRLLHGGSAYAQRIDYVQRAVFHSLGEPEILFPLKREGARDRKGSGAVSGAAGGQKLREPQSARHAPKAPGSLPEIHTPLRTYSQGANLAKRK